MGATVLVKEFLWRASILLGDTAPQFQRWTEDELVRWLQDGQTAIAKYLPSATARYDSVKLVAGTRQSLSNVPQANIVPGDGVALTAPLEGIQLFNITRNMGADGATPGKAITSCDRATLDNFNDAWHTETGAQVVNFVYDERSPTSFFVTPAAASLPWYVEIEWSVVPKTIPNPGNAYDHATSSSTQAITVDDKFQDDLLNYVLARAQLKDAKFAEATKSQMYATWFVNSINAQVKSLTGVDPNLQTLPGGTVPA